MPRRPDGSRADAGSLVVSGRQSGIAVVVTCYELGRTLGDALASLREQTYPPAEIVVVDDGSQDPYTRSVLAALEPPIQALRLEHQGPSAARNAGIQRTRSELVLLLDGDDLLAPTYLEKAAALLAARPDLAFVSCGLVAFGNASYHWTPPPYTVAESIARGACGHISTVFRRTLWESVGGFDPTLPAYEDLEFWLSALELGFVGEIIDEPLLHYRVRRGSRYETAISPDVYRRAKEAVLSKHRQSVEAYAPAILGLMLDFEREIREHGSGLLRAQGELEEQIREYDAERSELSTALRELGEAPIDWGDLRAALESTPAEPTRTPVHSWYVETFLRRQELEESGRVLEVRRVCDLPASKHRYDSIVLVDVLSDVLEPHQVLAACRKALGPGGTLLATFPCLAPGTDGRRRLFTEASVRALVCSVFDPAEAEVEVFGNLPAAVAASPISMQARWHRSSSSSSTSLTRSRSESARVCLRGAGAPVAHGRTGGGPVSRAGRSTGTSASCSSTTASPTRNPTRTASAPAQPSFGSTWSTSREPAASSPSTSWRDGRAPGRFHRRPRASPSTTAISTTSRSRRPS